MSVGVPVYEPRYYERAAQRFVASVFPGAVHTNVAWGLGEPLGSRAELDAVVRIGGRLVPVEIKSHVLAGDTDLELVGKARRLGFRGLVIVAPDATATVARRMAASRRPSVELLTFHPDLDEVADWYTSAWPAHVPGWVHDALATGRHHIRFMLTRPTRRGHLVIGQQRTRVYSTKVIGRLVDRLPAPPSRVLWSPQRFTIPRDVIARGSRLTPLGGFVPVDVDGDRLHRANHACVLEAEGHACRYCLRYAQREQELLARLLHPVAPVGVIDSGGRGRHAYYPEAPGMRRRILDAATAQRVRFDEAVTASIKAMIALPGSLHAGTMRPVAAVESPSASREAALC